MEIDTAVRAGVTALSQNSQVRVSDLSDQINRLRHGRVVRSLLSNFSAKPFKAQTVHERFNSENSVKNHALEETIFLEVLPLSSTVEGTGHPAGVIKISSQLPLAAYEDFSYLHRRERTVTKSDRMGKDSIPYSSSSVSKSQKS